jgi:hypothetical protein
VGLIGRFRIHIKTGMPMGWLLLIAGRFKNEENMNLRINENKNIAYINLSGQLDKKTILNAFDSVISNKKYKKGMGRLWDFRDADLSSLETETVMEMAQYSNKFPSGINDVKVALVTSSDLEYGLSRMFEMSSTSKTPIGVFQSLNEGEIWLMK